MTLDGGHNTDTQMLWPLNESHVDIAVIYYPRAIYYFDLPYNFFTVFL